MSRQGPLCRDMDLWLQGRLGSRQGFPVATESLFSTRLVQQRSSARTENFFVATGLAAEKVVLGRDMIFHVTTGVAQ